MYRVIVECEVPWDPNKDGWLEWVRNDPYWRMDATVSPDAATVRVKRIRRWRWPSWRLWSWRKAL
jgi:hypothetical protein